jgi:hypothetical protein
VLCAKIGTEPAAPVRTKASSFRLFISKDR